MMVAVDVLKTDLEANRSLIASTLLAEWAKRGGGPHQEVQKFTRLADGHEAVSIEWVPANG